MTYPATLSDLRGRLEIAFLSTAAQPGHWDATRKNQLLNDAQRQMQMRLDTMGEDSLFRHVDAVTPVSGVIHLKNDLSKDCIRPITLARQDGTVWTEVPIVAAADIFGSFRNSGECWYQLNDVLKTDYGIGSTAVRKVLYHYRVPDMTIDTDTCQLPADTHEVMVYEAAEMGCLQSREVEQAAYYRGEVEKRWSLVQRALKSDASTKVRRVRQKEFFGRGPRDMAGYRAFWTPQ